MKQKIKSFSYQDKTYTIYFETVFDEKYIRVYKSDNRIAYEYDLTLEELTDAEVNDVIIQAEKHVKYSDIREF